MISVSYGLVTAHLISLASRPVILNWHFIIVWEVFNVLTVLDDNGSLMLTVVAVAVN